MIGGFPQPALAAGRSCRSGSSRRSGQAALAAMLILECRPDHLSDPSPLTAPCIRTELLCHRDGNLVRYLHLMQGARHVFKTDTPLPVRDGCGGRARYGAYNHRSRRGRASSEILQRSDRREFGFGDLVGSVHGRAVRGRMVIDHQGCRGGGWWAVLLRAGERCGFPQRLHLAGGHSHRRAWLAHRPICSQ